MTKEENLHWLNREIEGWENECQSKHPIKEALYAAQKALEQEPRWIPVTERLPDEGYRVLVTRITDENYKYMRVATYQGDCWMDDTDKFNKPNPHKVIAWMPLPEPYEEDEE